MTDKTVNMDVDALLDGTLDDLADMPEFKPYPVGMHRVNVNVQVKKMEKHKAVEFKFSAIETIELPAGSEDKPLEHGAETSILLFLSHDKPTVAEMGQGQFKDICKQAVAKFGAKSNRELIEDMNGAEAVIVTSQRSNKDKTKLYTQLDGIEFA